MRALHMAVGALAFVSGCGGAGRPACTSGRTDLDGVCVDERVADYVACVRAKGAQLGSERSEKLAIEAQYAGARASALEDVEERLEKRYAGSDVTELEVIRTCSALHGMRRDGAGEDSGGTLQRADCRDAESWRSGDGPATTITFVNDAAEPLNLYWIDRSGARVHYVTIAPGADQVMNTFVTHAWAVVGAGGRCYGAVVAKAAGQHTTRWK